jgi:hypothetical protein
MERDRPIEQALEAGDWRPDDSGREVMGLTSATSAPADAAGLASSLRGGSRVQVADHLRHRRDDRTMAEIRRKR